MRFNRLPLTILLTVSGLLVAGCSGGAIQNGVEDKTSPYEVGSFAALAGDSQVILSWDSSFQLESMRVKILRKTTDDISSHADADAAVVYDGAGSNHADAGLSNGTTYYYKAFAYDSAGNYSAGINASAMPVAGTVNAVTFSPDGGYYSTPCSVELSTTTESAIICATTDGSEPACNAAKDACASGSAESWMNITETTTLMAVACRPGYADSAINSATYTIDTTAPIVVSSTPDDMAIDVAAYPGTISVTFDEPMNMTFIPALTTEAWDGSAYVSVPNAGTVLTWTNNRTLTITLSWVQFPESSEIRWTLVAANIRDIAGNTIAADVQRTFTTNSLNTYFPIADTGQTSCYDDGTTGIISCGNATYPGQDGDYADTPNARSFSKAAHATYTDDYTTTDNVTGLVWKTCSEGLSDASCTTGSASTYTWYNAINQCAALNTANSGAGYAGITNWRLPTPAELESLPDYSAYNPAIDATAFPATVASIYWSASTYVKNTTLAWYVYFYYGYSGDNDKTFSNYVRCVAGSSNNEQVFTDNGDGTVSDNATSLTWQKCSGTEAQGSISADNSYNATCSGAALTYTWGNALNYCQNLSLAAKSWRLPNVNELKSIVDRSAYNPSIDTTAFPGTVASSYWSASTYVNNTTYAWTVYFSSGFSYFNNKTSSSYVRCVTN